MVIGINLWFIPQISEHCPKNILERFKKNLIWLRRPGVASILILKEGIVHAWITSREEIIIRIWARKGRIRWVSVLINRNKELFEFM